MPQITHRKIGFIIFSIYWLIDTFVRFSSRNLSFYGWFIPYIHEFTMYKRKVQVYCYGLRMLVPGSYRSCTFTNKTIFFSGFLPPIYWYVNVIVKLQFQWNSRKDYNSLFNNFGIPGLIYNTNSVHTVQLFCQFYQAKWPREQKINLSPISFYVLSVGKLTFRVFEGWTKSINT